MSRSSLSNSGRTPIAFFLSVLLISSLAACQTQTAADTRAADETALRNRDNEWSKAASRKDVDKTVSYYADDAVVMPPNSPPLSGKEPIRSLWQGMLGAPGFSGGWADTHVEVARSGELAYVRGTYEFTKNDASGKPMTDKGKYVEIWKKQPDGSWKCIVDMFSSDLPLANPTENKTTTANKSSEKSK